MHAVCVDWNTNNFLFPKLKKDVKLPAVLNGAEVKALLNACKLLKHRLIIGLCYGCGLRCSEVRNVQIADADLERGMLHVRQGKGSKDRCIPLGKMLCRGIAQYISAANIRVIIYLKAMMVRACHSGEHNG